MTTTVFKARRLHHSGDTIASPKEGVSFTDTSLSLSPEPSLTSQHRQQQQQPHLLTKTDKYLVYKSWNFPQLLQGKLITQGSISSDFAVAINDTTIHVWNYTNIQSSSPITISFPYQGNEYGLIPFVVLIPNLETPNDPGLVIIDSYHGTVQFYESIINAPLLKVLNFKMSNLNLKLNNEFISMCEFIPNLGIFIATSQKKLMLITLKDNFNKPQLNKIDIIHSSSSFKFIISVFNNPNKTYDIADFNAKNNKIVAVRELTNDEDATRQVVIQDSDGLFEIWQFQKNSNIGIYKLNIKDSLCSILSDIYDNIKFSFKILDLVCLKHIASDVFLILASFNSDEQDLKNLILYTLKISKDGVLIYSTYKITCYNATVQDTPKLSLPQPYNTCFIIFANSMILAEVLTSLDPIELLRLNYKTKWEDLITFKKSVKIVGFGVESQNKLLCLTSNSGLLQIERLVDDQDDDEEIDELDLNLKLQQEPMLFIKSHIEQAIYYGTDVSLETPLYFSIPRNEDFKLRDIENAITSVLRELLNNESKYLPKIYPSVEEFLKKRNQIVMTLCEFIVENFNELSTDLKIIILNILNKFKIALHLHTLVKDDYNSMNILKSIISTSEQEDSVRIFFFNNLSEVPTVIYKFIKQSKDDVKILQLLGEISESYLKFEKNFRYDNLQLDNDYDLTTQKPFLIEADHLLLEMVQFFNSVNTHRDTLTIEQRQYLVNLAEMLFYSFNDILCYVQNHNLPISHSLLESYDSNKFKWIDLLASVGMNQLVLQIAETFKDMTSIVEVLMLPDQDVQLQYYFDKFGYLFAVGYYKYLIDLKDLHKLFKLDTSAYLQRFFNEYQEYDYIAWIYQLQIDKYKELSEILMNLTNDSVTSKQFNLSIAKLSLIESGLDKFLIDDIDYQLSLCQYQLDIETDESLPLVLKDKIELQQVLNVHELIDLLCHVKSELNFYRAYNIVKHLNDLNEFKLLFTRLLLIDDWDFLNDPNKTDEYLNSMVKSTITFKTIRMITQLGKINLDLKINELINKDVHGRISDDELNQMDDKLIQLDQLYHLDDWVLSIISMAQD